MPSAEHGAVPTRPITTVRWTSAAVRGTRFALHADPQGVLPGRDPAWAVAGRNQTSRETWNHAFPGEAEYAALALAGEPEEETDGYRTEKVPGEDTLRLVIGGKTRGGLSAEADRGYTERAGIWILPEHEHLYGSMTQGLSTLAGEGKELFFEIGVMEHAGMRLALEVAYTCRAAEGWTLLEQALGAPQDARARASWAALGLDPASLPGRMRRPMKEGGLRALPRAAFSLLPGKGQVPSSVWKAALMATQGYGSAEVWAGATAVSEAGTFAVDVWKCGQTAQVSWTGPQEERGGGSTACAIIGTGDEMTGDKMTVDERREQQDARLQALLLFSPLLQREELNTPGQQPAPHTPDKGAKPGHMTLHTPGTIQIMALQSLPAPEEQGPLGTLISLAPGRVPAGMEGGTSAHTPEGIVRLAQRSARGEPLTLVYASGREQDLALTLQEQALARAEALCAELSLSEDLPF